MTDAWAMAEEMAEAQKAEAGVFQKWEADGEAHVMVLCGAPYARKMHWTGTLYEDCAGKGCDACPGITGHTAVSPDANQRELVQRRRASPRTRAAFRH